MPNRSASIGFNRRQFVCGSALLVASCSLPKHSSGTRMKTHSIEVSAPFPMPTIVIPDFSGQPEFNIRDLGAIEGDKQATNQALAQAIDLASDIGGRVMVPAGEWLCGPIHLKSRVNLHLEQGATLLFSEDPADYLPAVRTSWEGLECFNYSPLIYAYECSHVAITGQGKLKAKLDVWREWYKRPKAHLDALAALYHQASKQEPVEQRQMAYAGANLRPHFVQFNRCQHVLVEGIQIEDSPFWVLHPLLCKDVVIRKVSVKAHGHNNDGVDPEMTQNMLIEECEFDQGDDAISVKAGRNIDGWRFNTPTRNIVMRHCRIKQAHQLLAVGSELSGGIENVLVEHCQFDDGTQYQGTGNVLLVKTNERRGGFVRNIHLRHISARAISGGALCVDTDVLYQWRDLVPTYEKRLTQIEGLYLQDVLLGEARFISQVQAQPDAPVQGVHLNKVEALALTEAPIQHQNVIGFEQQ